MLAVECKISQPCESWTIVGRQFECPKETSEPVALACLQIQDLNLGK